MFEKLKATWNKMWYGDVRRVKVRAKDIQNNILKIQDRITWVHKDIDQIADEMAKVDRSTDEGKLEYEALENQLKTKNELIGVLQKEMEQEYTTLKKFRDSKFMIQPKDALVIGGVIFLGTFMVALERENPKALKMCTFLLKLFPMHY